MSDFAIRGTDKVVKNWDTSVKESKPGLFDKNKGTSEQRIDKCQTSFTNFYHQNVGLLSQYVLKEDMQVFSQKAMDMFDEIVKDTFSEVEIGTTPKKDFHQLMVVANTRAREALQDLSSEFFARKEGWETDVLNSMDRGKDNVKVKTSSFDKVGEHLTSFMRVSTNEMRRVQKEGKLEAFDEAVKAMNEHLGEKFSELVGTASKGGKVSQTDFRDVIRTMQVEAHRELLKLSNDFPPSKKPSIFVDGEGEINVIRKAPMIENLVLQGGGAKGVGTPPHIVELTSAGMLNGLKHVVGTSAGALTAALMSSGMTVDNMQELMDETPLTDLQGKVTNFDTIYPGYEMKPESGTWGDRRLFDLGVKGGKDHPAEKALQLLDQNTTQPVHDFVRDNGDLIREAVREERISEEEGNQLIAKFTEPPNFEEDRSGKMVTFNDLALLHAIKPEQFKELTLTGWNKTDNQVDYFRKGEPHGDMPVCFAGRISMSIPIYFQAIEYGGKEYHDGGLGSNLPSEAITEGLEGQDLENVRAKTMLMVFDDKGKGFTTLFKSGNLQESPPEPKHDTKHKIMERTTGALMGDNKVKDLVKTYEGGPNTQVIFHGSVDTFDLNVSERNKNFAKVTSTLKALEQIEVHQQEGQQITVQSVEHLMTLLSPEEKQAIIDDGEPTSKEYRRPQDLVIARQLYDECVIEQDR